MEVLNRSLKFGARIGYLEGKSFKQAILDFLSNFRSSAPENGKLPSELLVGRKIWSTSDIRNPHLLPKDETVRESLPLSMDERKHAVERKFKKRRYGKAFDPFRNTPFYVGQWVLHRKPEGAYLKGQSPYSQPLKIL